MWTLKAAETSLNQRTVHLSKVSADGRDRSQDTSLTEGNERANALAKSLCQQQFQQHSDHSLCDVNCILAVQNHLVKSFVNRLLTAIMIRLLTALYLNLKSPQLVNALAHPAVG